MSDHTFTVTDDNGTIRATIGTDVDHKHAVIMLNSLATLDNWLFVTLTGVSDVTLYPSGESQWGIETPQHTIDGLTAGYAILLARVYQLNKAYYRELIAMLN